MTQNPFRVFFALNPDAETRSRLAKVSARIPDSAGRKVRPANFHLTLLFMGSVEQTRLAALQEDCAGIVVPAFDLCIERDGWWKKPKVAWLGPSTTPPALRDLAGQLNSLAQARGLPGEERPLQAHITLLRKATRPVAVPAFEPIHWRVETFCLMESLSHPEGVEYRELQSWPLGTG